MTTSQENEMTAEKSYQLISDQTGDTLACLDEHGLDLFLAAPDLLEALLSVLQIAYRNARVSDAGTIQNAEYIIAKAKGGAA